MWLLFEEWETADVVGIIMDSSGEFALKVKTMFYILLQQNDDNIIVYDSLKLS